MSGRFVFVNLSVKCGFNTGINHGIAYLVPVARRHGYDVVCLNVRDEISPVEFVEKVRALNPGIVAFSCTSQQFKYLMPYSSELSKQTQVLQIAGGVGPTLEPDRVLLQSGVNGVCTGEGEVPLDALLKNIEEGVDPAMTPGFCWVRNGTIKRNSVPQYVDDLSVLDFPDYSIFDRSLVAGETVSLKVMISRGCPYSCHYCCNRVLSCVYPSSKGYFRKPSVEHSVQLLKKLTETYPEAKFIDFEDDLLIADKPWFEKFADQYREQIGLPYRACVRIECINEEIADKLKTSGCVSAYMGLESGNEKLRADVLNRKYSNDMVIEKAKMIKDAGLKLFTFNIVGLPFEGRKEMMDTLRLNQRIVPDAGICTFFYPFRGTELYRVCEQNDLLRSEAEMAEITNYNSRPALRMTPAQERRCIYFKNRILNYLNRYSIEAEIAGKVSHLPYGVKRSLLGVCYKVRFRLSNYPLVFEILRKCYKFLGVKAVVKLMGEGRR